MAKMRVHELAKELDIKSADIVQELNKKGIDVKAASSIGDDNIGYIKSKFGKSNSKSETQDKSSEAKEDSAKEEKSKPRVIITSRGVVRTGERRSRTEGERRKRRHGESERHHHHSEEKVETNTVATAKTEVPKVDTSNQQKPKAVENKVQEPKKESVKSEVKTEAVKEEVKAETQKVENKSTEKSTETKTVGNKTTETTNNNRVAGQTQHRTDNRSTREGSAQRNNDRRPQSGDRPYRPNNNNGDRPYRPNNNNGDRPYRPNNNNGDRPYNRNNNNGDRPYNRPNNNNGDRPYNRPNNNNGDRPYRPNNNNGDRPYRPNNNNGDRPYNRPNNNNGDRPYRPNNNNGDRPYNRPNNNNGDRPYNRNNNNGDRPYRPNNNNGDRPYNRNNNNGDRPYRPNNNNGDRPYNRPNNNNGDRPYNNRNNNNNDRRGDFRKNDGKSTVAAEPIQNKDRKARENKLRQDRQERSRKEYENSRKGKTGRRDFSKPVIEKPRKKEEKKEEIKVIQVPDAITIGELAKRMKMQPSAVIKKLFLDGKMVTVNTEIDFESAEEIALGYEIMCEKEEKVDIIEELLKEDDEDESLMIKRPPVVCVMGHVDHGKTSLLDAIRETNVISGEAGGITQHIGASVVKLKDRTITFLDTPGHEAFTAMRMRGAQSTDIAILVVAADDGVMPQTVEAINHAKAANIEIIVAINKVDKPGANIERVKQGLAEHGLLAADWGGDVEMVPVSAHTKEGIDDLLEMVLLQADVLELKANPDREARGIVIEAKLDKGKGPVATILVQKGTLMVGANIAAGANHGKVRAMTDDRGNRIKMAGPSTPVEILGLGGVPNAGEVFVSTESSNEAKEFAQTFVEDSKAKLMESNKFRISLDDLNSQIEAGNLKELNIIIKADVQGSVEAVKQSLVKLSNEEVEVKVIHGGVGAVNESDVILASASNAIIIAFNVKPDAQAEEAAKRETVDLRLYSIIYNAIDDIERAMKGMLEPIYEEKVIGHAEVRQTFKASGVGTIAGSYVLDGMMQRGCSVRVTREGKQIFEGPLASLKRFKDDVKEVKAGYECGLVFENFNEVVEADQVEAYMMVEVPR